MANNQGDGHFYLEILYIFVKNIPISKLTDWITRTFDV